MDLGQTNGSFVDIVTKQFKHFWTGVDLFFALPKDFQVQL